jgi:hypothetical protein
VSTPYSQIRVSVSTAYSQSPSEASVHGKPCKIQNLTCKLHGSQLAHAHGLDGPKPGLEPSMAAHQGLTAARGGLWTPSSHDLGRCLGRPHLNQECSGSCRLSAQSELGPARPPAHLGPFAGKGREEKRRKGKGRERKGRETRD